MGAKYVTYGGVRYHRSEGRDYYEPSGTVLDAGGTSLHRQVYLDHHGPIPPGWHVHHADLDHDNNEPSNLIAMEPDKHGRLHLRLRNADPAQRLILYAWHNSDAGRAQLRANMAAGRAHTPEVGYTCRHCGLVGVTRSGGGRVYCSDDCEYAWRRAHTNIRECPICGGSFGGQARGKNVAETCSYQCGWTLRRQRRGVPTDN